MGFTLKSSRQAEVSLHDVAWQNVVAQNEHFVYAFADMDVVSGNDMLEVRFRNLTPFCTARCNVRNTVILMTFWRFQCDFKAGIR